MKSLLVCISALSLVSCVRTVQRTDVLPVYGVNETMARQVRNARDMGDGDYRIRALRNRVTANPEDVPARVELAGLYRESGFPDVAAEHYRAALAQQPESFRIALELARTLRSMNLPGEGLAVLQAFIARHPKAPAEVLSWIGILQDEIRDYGKAELNHRAALELNPNSDVFHNNLGYNLLLQKRPEEAAVAFRKALELNPGSQTARNNLGFASPAEALKTWSSNMDVATVHNNAAAILIERGDYAGARRELDLALGYKKDHSAALRNLQLLAELEGGEVRLPEGRTEPESRWEKFAHTMKVVMVGNGQAGQAQK